MVTFFIDSSALIDMFNGENKGSSKECLDKMKEMNDRKIPFKVITSKANFLRAIWLANPDAKINDIQKVLSFIEVGPSHPSVDFKKKEDVMNETVKIAKAISGDFT